MSHYSVLAKKSILNQPVYVPGKPIQEVARELHLDPNTIIKLASNENPLGPSPLGIAAAREVLSSVHQYPEDTHFLLKQRLAEKLNVLPEQLIIGHGSNEIIGLLCHVFVEPGVEVVMGEHAFISYKKTTSLCGGTPVEVPLNNFQHDLDAMAKAINERTRLIFLPSPNNPTARGNDAHSIIDFARQLPDGVILCFDAAYEEYMHQPVNLKPLMDQGKKIIVLRTFSKIYGLAALRVGYGTADPELIHLLNQVRVPFNVNGVGQAAAFAALEDDAFIEKSKRVNDRGRQQLKEGLSRLNIDFILSDGNFLLLRFDDAAAIYNYLQSKGVIVRLLTGYSLPNYIRVSVGLEEENKRFLDTLEAY